MEKIIKAAMDRGASAASTRPTDFERSMHTDDRRPTMAPTIGRPPA